MARCRSRSSGRWLDKAPRRWVLLAGVLACLSCDERLRSGRDGGATPAVDGGASGREAGGADDGGTRPDAPAADQGQACPGGYGGPPASGAPPIAGNWKLELQEDFSGAGLDDARWKVGQQFAGFNGIGATDPATISIGCGYLRITTEKRRTEMGGKGADYATGEISSFKRFRQRYGYFEARLRYDAVRGLWPAFWLMPDRGSYGNVSDNRISYLKFALAGVSGPVQSATLELHVDAAEGGVQNVMVVRVADDSWSEGTITGSNRPPIDPQWIAMRFDPRWSGGETVSFDLTSYVNEQLAADKVVSLALIDGFMRARRVSFASKESGNAAHRPRLVLSGAAAPVIVSEDAAVGEGDRASQNMGTDTLLHVDESWGDGTSTYNGGMEIDIMESLAQWGQDRTSHAMHWDGYGAEHQNQGSGHIELTPTSDGFHVYGVHWQQGVLHFFVDGKQTFSWSNARVASVPAFIILSLQVGGWADKYGDNKQVDDAALPATMLVDYVRVWSGSPN